MPSWAVHLVPRPETAPEFGSLVSNKFMCKSKASNPQVQITESHIKEDSSSWKSCFFFLLNPSKSHCQGVGEIQTGVLQEDSRGSREGVSPRPACSLTHMPHRHAHVYALPEP